MAQPADLLAACIDAPSEAAPADSCVLARGWCFGRQGRRILGLRIKVGRKCFAARQGLPRPDVGQAFGSEPGSAASGFEAWLQLPSGGGACVFEALMDGEGWMPFHSLVLRAPERNTLAEGWKWLGFWRRALVGVPSALDGLSAGEQGFLLHRLSERGWTNLDRAFQHDPHPVRRESFPRRGPRRNSEPKFSLVTPCFNHARFIEQAMRSVLDQEGVELEYLVQDGASTDGSRDIIERVSAKESATERLRGKRISWASEADEGQADAIRRGFARSSGGPEDIMGYLNSDDQLMPGALGFVADYFARHPGADVVYGHRVLIDEQGLEVGRWMSPRPRCAPIELHDFIPQETLFWRRRVWDRVGGLDPSFRFALDWDLILRFHRAGARFERLPWFLGQFRVHPQQKSQSLVGSAGLEEMALLRALSLGRSPTKEELDVSFRRALLDSGIVAALLRRGLRL